MVHAQTPSLLLSLDPKRIAGYSVTISLHVMAFMLLLAPMQAPAPAAVKEVTTLVDWEEKKKDPPPIPEVPVTQQRPRPTTQPQRVQVPQEQLIVDQPPAAVDAGSIPAVEDVGALTTFETADPALAQLMTRFAPPPPYPALAEKRRMQGTVGLMILVGAQGNPIEVTF